MMDREGYIKFLEGLPYGWDGVDPPAVIPPRGGHIIKGCVKCGEPYTCMEGWIKITDRKPEELPILLRSDDVLVYGVDGVSVGCWFRSGEWCDADLYVIKGVTHWMPLPKPPQDGTEGFCYIPTEVISLDDDNIGIPPLEGWL